MFSSSRRVLRCAVASTLCASRNLSTNGQQEFVPLSWRTLAIAGVGITAVSMYYQHEKEKISKQCRSNLDMKINVL